jgi:hypothetical protein
MATYSRVHIANSVRLILALFRLYADIETQFGKAIIDVLNKQFPGQKVDKTPGQIGRDLMNIARRQLQGNDSDAMDSVQDFLTYITTGSKYETDANGVVQHDENGPIPRKDPKSWDFTRDFKSPKEALEAMYSNIKSTAMGQSQSKTTKKKYEKGIDESFGRRTDDGNFEDAEGRIPTGEETALGKALDDKAAIKEFIGLIDEHLPDLRAALSPDSLKLFDLIFEDDIGSFGSDIKENMGQASALKEKYPELFEKNAKRWSGFVGDLRKKLLDEIWKYIETEMSYNDYVRLRDQFFSDVDPSVVRELEKAKSKGKDDYQRGLDERKLSRLKEKQESDGLNPKEEADLARLTKRLADPGTKTDPKGAKSKHSFDLFSIASRLLDQ